MALAASVQDGENNMCNGLRIAAREGKLEHIEKQCAPSCPQTDNEVIYENA